MWGPRLDDQITVDNQMPWGITIMKNHINVAVLAIFAFAGAAVAEDDAEGHIYLGGSTGYYKTTKDREAGNTRTLGANLGYQFNEKWSAEYNYMIDSGVGSPGKDSLNVKQINVIRHWGDNVRFLVDFGVIETKFSDDDSYFGYHVGTGLSAFVTEQLELRGNLKLIYFGADGVSDWVLSDQNEESFFEGLGTISLNYHFGRTRHAQEDSESVLGSSGESREESLPPMQYREPVEAEEPAVEEPAVEEPVAVVTPPEVVVPAPAVTQAAAPTGPAKSTHTLQNFNSDSIDVSAAYGSQLDQISSEIITSNSRAVVEGHTDNQGSPVYNKVLSADRAIIVKRELKKRGVKGEDLSIVGYGEERPVATNETAEGRTQNRRVEVKLYDK